MEDRFELGKAGGTLLVRASDGRAVFEADRPDDRKGLYKAYLTGKNGHLLLGTLMPEGGRLRLRRTLTVTELERKGVWPVTGGSVELAYSFGQGGEQPDAARLSGGWSRERQPARLMGDRLLRQAASEIGGALTRHEEDGFALAVPYTPRSAFPMTGLFCFARIERLGGRDYAVFHFNRCGCPVFKTGE